MKKWILDVEEGCRITATTTSELLKELAKKAEEFNEALVNQEDDIFFKFLSNGTLLSLRDRIGLELEKRNITKQGELQ